MASAQLLGVTVKLPHLVANPFGTSRLVKRPRGTANPAGASFFFPEATAMLVLSRKVNEDIVIGDDIVITVVEIRRDRVRLGIAAPQEVVINRKEIQDLIDQQRAEEKTDG